MIITDLAQAESARLIGAAIMEQTPSGLGPKSLPPQPENVVVRQGDFEFGDLAVWRELVSSHILAQVPGVISSDLDEVANRVTIGIQAARITESRSTVEKLVLELGIPLAAVRVTPATKPTEEQQLTDGFSSLVGGIEIDYGYNNGTFVNTCTLGMVVAQGSTHFFLTNAHCTTTPYVYDGQRYDQPTWYSSYVGQEFNDIGFTSCGFLSPNDCRESDSALIYIASGVSHSRGYIARTTTRGGPGRPATGSLTIDTNQPTWRNFGKSSTTVGQELDKVGRTSGWTYGTVRETCVDIEKLPDKYVRCSHAVDYGSDGGDSGSPVFRIHSLEFSQVYLHGIHWGGNYESASCANCALFSPISGIETDLGTLTVIP